MRLVHLVFPGVVHLVSPGGLLVAALAMALALVFDSLAPES